MIEILGEEVGGDVQGQQILIGQAGPLGDTLDLLDLIGVIALQESGVPGDVALVEFRVHLGVGQFLLHAEDSLGDAVLQGLALLAPLLPGSAGYGDDRLHNKSLQIKI